HGYDATLQRGRGSSAKPMTQPLHQPGFAAPGEKVRRAGGHVGWRLWQRTVSARAGEPLALGTATRRLAPGEEFTAFDLDPRRWFDLERPGCYRLRFRFHAAPVGFTEGVSP